MVTLRDLPQCWSQGGQVITEPLGEGRKRTNKWERREGGKRVNVGGEILNDISIDVIFAILGYVW